MRTEETDATPIPGYQLLASFCRNSQHGGVGIYGTSKSSGKPINLINYCVVGIFECAGITCKIFNKKCAILVVYRWCCYNSPEQFNIFFLKLNETLQYIFKHHEIVLITGDLNVNNLEETSLKKQLYDLLEGFGLANILPTEPTRDFGNQKPSALDYVITNDNFRAVNSEIGIADHKAQLIFYEFPNCEKEQNFITIEKRSFSAQKMFNLKAKLNQNDFSPLYSIPDANDAWQYFSNTLHYFLDYCDPIRRKTIKLNNSSLNWVDSDIIRESKQLKELYWVKKKRKHD